MATNTLLFPPLLDNVQKGFIYTNPVRVYFIMPQYNNPASIASIQFTVVDVLTNKSVLNDTTYIGGVKISPYTQGKNYIDINPSDLLGGFIPDGLYKLQIRFTDIAAEALPKTGQDAWLARNMEYFSEWSNPSLLRPVYDRHMVLNSVEAGEMITIATNQLSLTGRLIFENPNAKDYLRKYRVKVLLGAKVIADTGLKTTNTGLLKNEVYAAFPNILSDSNSYKIEIFYQTDSLFQTTEIFNLTVNSASTPYLEIAAITATPDPDEGLIALSFNLVAGFNTPFMLKRLSSKDGYSTVEEVMFLSASAIAAYPLDSKGALRIISINDLTVENGVGYIYFLAYASQTGMLAPTYDAKKVVAVFFEDTYLVGQNNLQLKLPFNTTISSYRKNKNDVIIPTLGSKFPFTRRNGASDYKSFGLSSLISFHIDPLKLFFNDSIDDIPYDILEHATNLEDRLLNDYTDVVKEKVFRDKVIDFLYDGTVKLFKSPTEGNMLIRLTDVGLEPVTQVNRMLYHFSCTCTENDSFNLNNLEKYLLINRG